MGEAADSAVLASWLESENAKGLRNDHALDLVVWGWDTLEDLESLHGGGTTGGLVWDHTTDGLVEDAGWSAEMEWTTTGWVVAGHLAEVGVVLHYKITSVSVRSIDLGILFAPSQVVSLNFPYPHIIRNRRMKVGRTLSTEELSRDV